MNNAIQFKKPDLYSSIHYTPQYLARSIVERTIANVDYSKKHKLKILDPACGSGTFLMEVLKQLNEKGYRGTIHVDGLDSSSCAVSTTKFLLSYEQRVQWKENLSYEIKEVENSLSERWPENYDIILMNPPFLSMELVKKQEDKDAINHALADCKIKGRPNQAAAFLNKALDALDEDGFLGAVLPSSLLLYDQYIPLRKKIRETAELQVIAKLGSFVFDDALADVSFIVVHKNNNGTHIPQTIWCKNKNGVAYEALKEFRKFCLLGSPTSIKENFNIYTPSCFPLVRQTWKTVPMSDDNFIQSVEQWRCVGKLAPMSRIFSIRQGALKGCREAFEITTKQYEEQLDKQAKQYFRPLASTDTIQGFKIMPNKYIWFPYNVNGLTISNEDDIPTGSAVDESLRTFKSKLEKRKGVEHWWALSRPRAWQFVPSKCMSIVSKRFGNSRSFAINNGTYVVEECNSFWINNPKADDDYYFYFAIMTSSTFERLLSIYAKPLLSGYDLGNSSIKNIPLPLVDVNSEVYMKLCELGKERTKNDLFSQEAIDEYVKLLYPYEETLYR